MENAPRKEKDFFTKADPYIDTWYLIRGMVRPVFDLEKFVETYPNLDSDLNELRCVQRQLSACENAQLHNVEEASCQCTTIATKRQKKKNEVEQK